MSVTIKDPKYIKQKILNRMPLLGSLPYVQESQAEIDGPDLAHGSVSKARYLHDGRARTLTEAILWHGGEAHASRVKFETLSAPERAAMIAFLQSL